jgi:hypothetical protein
MTRRDLTRLFIRVFGILILLSTAIRLPSTINGFEWQMKAWVAARVVYDLPSLAMTGVSYFGPIAIYAALGLSFMWWSGRIVDRASLSPQDEALPVASADMKNIEVSLVTVIGLYFLADGFAELCRFTFRQGLIYGLDLSVTLKSIWTGITRFEVVSLLQIMVELTIGAALVLGRGATVAMLHQAHQWVRKWRAWPHELEQDKAH